MRFVAGEKGCLPGEIKLLSSPRHDRKVLPGCRWQNATSKLSGGGGNVSWDAVYSLIKKIPRGRVATYGDLARKLRLRGGARAVGFAMAACPSGRGIPWHRVVGAGGKLLIPEPHGSLQRRLLESEGVRVDFERIDMTRFAWKSLAVRRTRSARRKMSR